MEKFTTPAGVAFRLRFSRGARVPAMTGAEFKEMLTHLANLRKAARRAAIRSRYSRMNKA